MRKTIGVMGSGTQSWDVFAKPLGAWIARSGFNLLTGAGNGVMTSVSRAFIEEPSRLGQSIGIVKTDPCLENGFAPSKGYPNPYVEIPIYTPLAGYNPDTPTAINRNYINILSSDLIIALPGGLGTINEIELALQFGKPIILFAPLDYYSLEIEKTESIAGVKKFAEKVLT